MMLGDILREAREAAAVLDPALRSCIEASGETPGSFARAAVASFEREASEEDWATMISAIRRAADPGKACLDIMVRWRLERSRRRAAHNATDPNKDTT
jgi:hypothetical protein